MRINDNGLRRANRRQKQKDKKRTGMRVTNRSIFILEEQKVRKAKKEKNKKLPG